MASIAPESKREGVGRPAPARRSIYVFELPVRLVHWTVVGCLLVLSLTGLYIEHPIRLGGAVPAHPGYMFATVRFIHEVTAFVFIAAVLFRIYWAFAGNRYAHWRALLPVTKGQRQDLRDTVQFYTYRRRQPVRLNGHNPLAGLAYVALYVLFMVSILTGLGLYAWLLRRPPWTSLFGWTYTVVSVPTLRLVHFLLLFFFVGFAVHHVYSAVLFDIEEHNGEMSSIFTGYKANLLEEGEDEK